MGINNEEQKRKMTNVLENSKEKEKIVSRKCAGNEIESHIMGENSSRKPRKSWLNSTRGYSFNIKYIIVVEFVNE